MTDDPSSNASPSPNLQPLSPELVKFIAAGETIDSPAAAVRELLDNAIDAGATRVSVSLDLTRGWIRVVDNGAGMDLPTLQVAVIAHTTSKLRDRSDLERIESLGFRGEALHSLAQLSSLSIASRINSPDGLQGWRVSFDSQGQGITENPVAIAPGTIVEVDQLFNPLPARQESLPSLPQQQRQVQITIQNAALAHPHIAWQVYKQERLWFSLGPGATACDILPQVLTSVRYSDLQHRRCEITLPARSLDTSSADSTSVTTVDLVIGLPDRAHRRRLDWVRIMVNGRLVHMPELASTVTSAFHRTLPRDRHPIAVVHLTIPAGWVDWNRTPSKREIYLRQGDWWVEQLRQAVADTLAITPTHQPDGYQTQRVRKLLKVAEPKSLYQIDSEPDAQTLELEPRKTSTPLEPALPKLRAVGQVNQTYIVAEHPGGLWLIEQHVAHERVLYEELGDRWKITPLPQALVVQGLSESDRDQLADIGIEYDEFGDNLWAIRSVPAPLVDREDLESAVRELAKVDDYNEARAAVACRTAIKNGMPLEFTEMQTLINNWQKTKNARTCPHGRPIYLSLEESSLSRFFRRHWVIGKSHGV
ncbi:MAG: DNA mismatch repair endonuclease MutL [Cyanobacteria bacterium P01_C01_bin.89]